MSMHVTRGALVHDNVVARPRPHGLPGTTLMGAVILVFLLAVGATVLGRSTSDDAQVNAGDVLMQGP